MQLVEELYSFKEKCQDVLHNIKNIKKVDKDIIAQMNQSICIDSINNSILNNDEFCEQYKDQVGEMIQIYEQATQNIDDIMYKHKGIKPYLMSDIKIQNNKDENLNRLKQDISQFTYFRLFEKLNVLENNSIEFKNYNFNSFKNRELRNICKKTIVSFLNRDGGCIYIGIRDDSTVVGIKLDYQQMDNLKRKIITIKSGIYPPMNEKVKVDFVPIKQNQRWHKGYWVVRIMVKQGDLNILYYYNNQNDHYSLESYFREDGAVIRYNIHDFIKEQVDNALQKNPKSRILQKKEYAQADQDGLEASMVWSNEDEQSSIQRNSQNSSEFSSNQHKELSNQKKIFKNDLMHEDQSQNIPKHKFTSIPFERISINENDIKQIQNFNYQEDIQKLQQDANQRKNQLISNRDNYRNEQFQQNKEQKKLYQQIEQNKQYIQNMNTQNEQELVNQYLLNQQPDLKNQHQNYFNCQEDIQKLQQNANQRKNQLISNRDNDRNEQFKQNKEQQKLNQQIQQNEQYIQNMIAQNELKVVNQYFLNQNQQPDQKNQHQIYYGQNQKQNNPNPNYQNQQNQFYENLQKNNNIQQIQQIQNQSNEILPQNNIHPNNQNQKKKSKKFGVMFYQALCGQQQQN
ncbi:hypothetical protein ABPG72_012886 [Tetrahymena utriculariae]